MKKCIPLISFLGSMAIFVSCAKDVELDLTEFEEGIFDRWMAKHHPEATPLESPHKGLYVDWIERNPDGMKLRDGYWIELNYTARDQNGNIFLTRNKAVARQILGPGFDRSVHYVPELIQYVPGSLVAGYAVGQVEALSLMQEGDSLRVFVPPFKGYMSQASSYPYYNSYYEGYSTYFESGTASGFSYTVAKHYGFAPENISVSTSLGLIFDMKIKKIIKDINLYEREKVERFAADSLGVTELSDSIALGVFFRKLEENPEGDSVKLQQKAKIYYKGAFLDGFVFDSNIDSVILAHRLSSTADTTHVYPDKFINGVKTALLNMKSGERARVVMVSEQGYGTTGSSDEYTGKVIIPPRTPLQFELYVERVDPAASDDDDE